MQTKSDRFQLAGSDRNPLHGARATGPILDDERFEVTVRVRRKAPLSSSMNGFNADVSPSMRRYMTQAQYEKAHGADLHDFEKVEKFAKEYGLVVVGQSQARRSIYLSGTAKQFAPAFGTRIEHQEHDGGTYRGRVGMLSIPSDLANIIEGVFGIDDRPVAEPHFQRHRPQPSIGIQAHLAPRSFNARELAKLYNFPTGLDGEGQTIGLIELSGGYRPADLATYFQRLGLPMPNVKAVRVDGGKNQPSTPDSADGEVLLDIEVAAAVAPKATIIVYFAPNTDRGFLDAITAAIHDTTNMPSVISISWGSAEVNWTTQAMEAFDEAFQTAAALGITIFAASGDNGSGDGMMDGKAHADFPASSPHVVGTGGTKLIAANGSIQNEVVWNDGPDSSTGGGVSDVFAVPDWQKSAGVPASANDKNWTGRGVPDVAGDADPSTGYIVRVDGEDAVFGGTSGVAPLWAGLIALFNQKLGTRVGFLNPLLYGSLAGSGVFRDVTSGNNGDYLARKGWDPNTGWGSPDGAKLLKALGG